MDNHKKRELDCQVAEKVMGWKVKGKDSDWCWWGIPPGWTAPESVEIPRYSSDIASAWKVVERMRDLWTAYTARMDREAAYKKFLEMTQEQKAMYLDPSGIVEAISVEMAGPEPFSAEAFFNRLHRKIDRRWPWAFFYLDPFLICEAAVAAFPPVAHPSGIK